jgi:hypothetical protein
MLYILLSLIAGPINSLLQPGLQIWERISTGASMARSRVQAAHSSKQPPQLSSTCSAGCM